MGWSLGANDSANIFGTAVSSGIIKYRTAIILCALFVMAGALLEGEKCMKVLNDLAYVDLNSAFAITLAAAITMSFLTYLALPASTSQAIVGSIIGWTLLYSPIDMNVVRKVVICWVLTPVCGAIIGWVMYMLFLPVVKTCFKSVVSKNRFFFCSVLIAGCYGAYSLGTNNVANVVGVYVGAKLLTPKIASLIGGMSISLGVLTYSHKVMYTVGKGIVPLDPYSAVISLFAEASVLHLFTQIGIPVSSSQAIVGSVIGVGIAKDVSTMDIKNVIKIFMGWIITPTAAGIISLLARIVLNVFIGG